MPGLKCHPPVGDYIAEFAVTGARFKMDALAVAVLFVMEDSCVGITVRRLF